MKNIILILFAFFLTNYLNSQTLDTLYFKNYETQSTRSSYDYYRIITKLDNLTYDVKEYYKGDSLKSTFLYKTKKELDISDVNIKKLIKRKKLLLHGNYFKYSNDSIIIGETKYEFGKTTYGPVNYYNGDTLYMIVDEMPEFQGKGLEGFREFIATHLNYPPEAAEKGIKGRVFVQFYIDKKGEVKNVRVIKGADPILDKEAVRVIKSSPKWTPGRNKGVPASVNFTFPIVFIL